MYLSLGRKAKKRESESQQRKNEQQPGSTSIGTSQVVRTTEGDKAAQDCSYDTVGVQSSAEGKRALHQGLDVETQDYITIYVHSVGKEYLSGAVPPELREGTPQYTY